MSIPRVLSGKWLTNGLLALLSFICYFGFNRVVASWDELTRKTDTNASNIVEMRKDVDANSRVNNNQQLDLDLLKKKSYEQDADIKILQHNERTVMQADKPHTPLLPQASNLWANPDPGGRNPQSREWFPIATLFDNRRKLWAPGWLYHSGHQPNNLH